MSQVPSDVRPVRRWAALSLLVAVLTFVLALLVLSFAWPASRSEASGLRIAVAGDEGLVAEFASGLKAGLGDAVDVVEFGDRAQIVSAIGKREVIGGLVLTMPDAEVLMASAAGQVPAAFMEGVSSHLQMTLAEQTYHGIITGLQGAVARNEPGASRAVLEQVPSSLPHVISTDVVPYSEGDPNGVGLTAAGIPLTVGALLVGVAMASVVVGRQWRVTVVIAFAAIAGLILTIALGSWLDVFPGAFGTTWLSLSLSLLATTAVFVGLHALLGRVGLAVAGAVTLFAAMPWAAFAVPYSFLPAGLGNIGQLLVPGATATLVRGVGYFPHSDLTGSWWVLAGWSAFGLALAVLSRQRKAVGHGRAS